MSALARATRALKTIDQDTMATGPNAVYIPLENHQTWTMDRWQGIDSGLNIATFYACVRVLAESVASLPLFLYRRLPNGGKERATDHELYPLFHDAANPVMTSFVWRELLVSHMASWGDHFSEKVYDAVNRLQLWPIRPDRMDVRWGKNGTKLYDYLDPVQGRRPMAPDSVFHVPALSSNGLRGYAPVALHRKTLEVHNAAREFGRSFFKNGARPGFVLTHKKTLSDGAVDRLATQMDELRGPTNAGKTVVLEEDTGLHEIGIPPDDAQYMQTRVFEAREIQKIFRMPPHMVGDLERATFSNIEHQGIEFVVYTLRPWLVRIEQEINAQLLFDQPDVFAEFLVDGLLRGDALGRAQALQVQRQNGVINGDEWREIENRNPIEDGSGKEYWMPVNFQVALTDVPEVLDAGQPSAAQLPPLAAVKSAAVRCQNCNRLLAEEATPPYRMTCARCKAVTEVATPTKSVESSKDGDVTAAMKAIVGLAGREQEVLTVAKAALDLATRESEPPPAPIVNPVVEMDTTFFEEKIISLEARLNAKQRVVRDDAGRIIGLEPVTSHEAR